MTDVPQAAASIRTMVTGLDGYVVSEQIGSSDVAEPAGGEPEARASVVDREGEMTLSVPSVKLDPTLDRLGQLGTVVDRSTSSEDVTSQYVDTESRLWTMRASVDRVRALMGRATALGQVVQLEGELSRRQGDLEATGVPARRAQGQRGALHRHGAAARPGGGGGVRARHRLHRRADGRLARVHHLGHGGAHGRRAVLPFAVVAALVGVPVLWWLRRRRAAPGGPGAGQDTGLPVPDGPAAR